MPIVEMSVDDPYDDAKPLTRPPLEAIDPPPFRDEKLPPACRKPPTTDTEGGAYSADDVSKLTPADLEAFLTVIYKSLATRDVPVADKVHVLAYLYRVSRVDGE